MDRSNLPEPYRGGQGHPDEQVRAEGSFLALVVLALVGWVAVYGGYRLVSMLWSSVQSTVGG